MGKESNNVFAPFDIPKNLVKAFETTSFYQLAIDLEELNPDGKGIYALYAEDQGKPAYVGKTDKSGNVRKRLLEHARKIEGRKNIKVSDIRFRYLIIHEDWLVRACEEYLIKHYSPAWQGSGFGSHVPGAGRPGKKGPNRFDQMYPPM